MQKLTSKTDLNLPFLSFNPDNGTKITILDFNDKTNIDIVFLIERFLEENFSLFTSRILSRKNLLIQELSLRQNLTFFREIEDLSKESILNIQDIFKKHLNQHRGDFDEEVWEAFGLLLYLSGNYEIFYVGDTIGQVLNGKYKSLFINILNNEFNKKNIIFKAHPPPAIELYKQFTDSFLIYQNNTLSHKMLYDDALREVITYNNKK